MTTAYTTSLRLPEMVAGDPTVANAWGTILSTAMALIDAAICGQVAIAIGGLTTYTLTTANGAADQARQASYNFTGALTANCTVTLPGVPKFGFAQNNTTGGYSVILTTGSGTTLTLPSNSGAFLFVCDGVNVYAIDLAVAEFSTGYIAVTGTVYSSATSGTLTMAAGTARLRLTANSTINNITIKLPPNPIDGQLFSCSAASGNVNNLNLQNSSGGTSNILTPPGSLSGVNGIGFVAQWSAANGQWTCSTC